MRHATSTARPPRCRSTSGSGIRNSMRTNATSSTAAAISRATNPTEDQPQFGAWEMPNSNANRPADSVPAPSQSTLPRLAGGQDGTIRHANAVMITSSISGNQNSQLYGSELTIRPVPASPTPTLNAEAPTSM